MSQNDAHQFSDRYMLRMPDGLRERIKMAAEVNARSMNAEIIDCLLERFPASAFSQLPPGQQRMIENGANPLRVIREHLGWSRNDLARQANLNPTVINDIENGRRVGSVATLKAVADVLGISIDDLV